MNHDDTFHASIHAAAATDNPRQDDQKLIGVMARAMWEQVGWREVDYATVSFGAAAALAALRKFEEGE